MVDCGRQQTVAVSVSGNVYTWGVGYEGALGHGTKDNQKAPKKVEGLPADAKIIHVACGRGNLRESDGACPLSSYRHDVLMGSV